MLNQKGQQYAVMKILQGAVFASVLLVLVYGVVTTVQSYFVSAGPLEIGSKVLSSAYAAAGTVPVTVFSRTAILEQEEFSAEAIARLAGLPDTVVVDLQCTRRYCSAEGDRVAFIENGYEIQVCALCDSVGHCVVNFEGGC